MTALFWLSAVADAVVLLALLLGRRGLAALALVPAAALKAIAAAGVGFGHFGLAHIVYLDVVVALPLVGIGLLVAERRRRRVPVALAGLALLLLAPVGVYASFVEPGRLQTERATVPVDRERAGDADLRVAVVADIQTDDVGGYERRAVRRVNALRPHVVLLPGDLFQMNRRRFERELPELRALVAELDAPGGVFVVDGDADNPSGLRRVLHGTGARLLENRVTTTRVAGRRVTIGGVEGEWRSTAAARVYDELERRPGADDLRILLVHRPDAAYELPDDPRTDLVVAGHTHGGQVQIPGFGPPVDASSVPREVGGGGLHTMSGGRRIYVSRGVGREHANHAPPLRLFCPPEVSLLTLRG